MQWQWYTYIHMYIYFRNEVHQVLQKVPQKSRAHKSWLPLPSKIQIKKGIECVILLSNHISPDWKEKFHVQTYSCPRYWRTGNSSNHHSTMVLRGLMRALDLALIMPRDASFSDSQWMFSQSGHQRWVCLQKKTQCLCQTKLPNIMPKWILQMNYFMHEYISKC